MSRNRCAKSRRSSPRPGRPTAWLAVVGVLLVIGLAAAGLARWPSDEAVAPGDGGGKPAAGAPAETPPGQVQAQLVANPSPSAVAVRPANPIDGQRAYKYLNEICAIGTRVSGSPGMQRQQEMLKKHFESLGGEVSLQRFQARNPLGGDPVPMANLIVRWHPERKDRILICAHYDTRPIPDRDPNRALRREGVFLGANDGGSGTALLMELAHLMPGLGGKYGVDFVMFDGEEFVYNERRDPYFLGSTWFAQQYVKNKPDYRYRWGVLLDMVGDADLQIYQDRFSVAWRDTRPLVDQIWATAARLGVYEFIPRPKYEVRDDHLPLRNIGKIPTCDIIDFDYPAWHTAADTPRQCSAESLAKVGWVVYEWLKTQ